MLRKAVDTDILAEIVGDSLTALTFLRNLFSTIFVFAMPAWVAAVGIPNVFNTICAIGIFILSWAGIFIWKYVKRWGGIMRWRNA